MRFLDLDQERVFQEERRTQSVTSARYVAYLGIFFIITFVWQDNIISPELGYIAVYIRLYGALPVSFLAIGATYSEWGRRHIDFVLFCLIVVYTVAVVAIFLVFQGTNYGLTSSVGVGNILILLFGVFGITRFQFLQSLALGFIIVVVYTVPCWILWAPDRTDFILGDFLSIISGGLVGGYVSFVRERRLREAFVISRQLAYERHRYQDLLFQVMPPAVAERIRRGESPIADSLSEITILFSDLVGFTQLTQRIAPRFLVRLLDDLFSEYDKAAAGIGVERIKTIGDGYMAVCGPPVDEDVRPVAVARLAHEMFAITERVAKRHDVSISLRVGIHTGSLVAGVIGRQRLTYDIWGEAVNIASRLETTGVAGKIHVSQATCQRISGHFEWEERGKVELIGLGEFTTYFLGMPREETASLVTDS